MKVSGCHIKCVVFVACELNWESTSKRCYLRIQFKKTLSGSYLKVRLKKAVSESLVEEGVISYDYVFRLNLY